eukprot:snap_masked-scaffold_2-processed-gene-9.18-mRNA-1 protein AED:1.00 eAED:1.00 QI:0/0/0/0/1/1/2/0/322
MENKRLVLILVVALLVSLVYIDGINLSRSYKNQINQLVDFDISSQNQVGNQENVEKRNNEPKFYSYNVVDKFSHDSKNFVEGFLFTNSSHILESAGLTGKSKLIAYSREGKQILSYSLDKKEFAEGITIWNTNVLCQLTYKKKNLHFYKIDFDNEGIIESLELLGTAKYPLGPKEGWGLTTIVFNSEELLLMGDGTSKLFFLRVLREKTSFSLEVVKTVSVQDKQNDMLNIKGLNELETVSKDSNLFPGTWCIVLIDLSGNIISWIDLTNIDPDFTKFDKVLNGIAITKDELWVTGKKWNSVYRIALFPTAVKKLCSSPWGL